MTLLAPVLLLELEVVGVDGTGAVFDALVRDETAPDDVVAEAEVVEIWRFRASAGSWPVASVIVISNQVATNRAIAPVRTRRRIIRALSVRVMEGSLPTARRNTVRPE